MTPRDPNPDAVCSTEELRACPFCGSADIFTERADYSSCYAICNNCGAKGPLSCDETEADADASENDFADPGELPARRLWNTRATRDLLRLAEALEPELRKRAAEIIEQKVYGTGPMLNGVYKAAEEIASVARALLDKGAAGV